MPENMPVAVPMVSQKTRAESTNIETIIGRLKSKRLIIPDYQRDAEQWDLRKESLFIESLLNNLTIPAFFFAEREDGLIEVVDGQQRLATTLKYANDEFAMQEWKKIVKNKKFQTTYSKFLGDMHTNDQLEELTEKFKQRLAVKFMELNTTTKKKRPIVVKKKTNDNTTSTTKKTNPNISKKKDKKLTSSDAVLKKKKSLKTNVVVEEDVMD